MEKGNVITVEDFVFLDGFEDVSGYERKCIVLFNDGDLACICPVVEQVSSFNANPHEYYLLPLTNRNGRKLLFAKLSSILYIKQEEMIECVDFIDSNTLKRMLLKLKDNWMNYNNPEYFEELVNTIEERSVGVK